MSPPRCARTRRPHSSLELLAVPPAQRRARIVGGLQKFHQRLLRRGGGANVFVLEEELPADAHVSVERLRRTRDRGPDAPGPRPPRPPGAGPGSPAPAPPT